jgi:hypothetical protein
VLTTSDPTVTPTLLDVTAHYAPLPLLITAPATTTWVAGMTQQLQLGATGGDGQYTYSSVGSTPGLTIDPVTGVVSGTLTAAGPISFTAVVTDGSRATSSQPVAIVVVAGNPAQVSLAASAPSTPAGTGSVTFDATVTDTFGNPVAGAAVTLAPSSPSVTVGSSPATTDATGKARFIASDPTGETASFTASVPTGPSTAITSPALSIDFTVAASVSGLAPSYTFTAGTAITPITLTVGGYPVPALVVTGLPAGLSVIGTTISGTPTTAGYVTTTATAGSASQTAAIAVGPTLTVNRSGSGAGTVTSSPAGGIDCGAVCTATPTRGTSVTLTATASAGSTFIGWSGACSGPGTCTLTLTNAATVTATFGTAIVGYTVTVTTSGTGAGVVTSSPAGINCGTTCSATFAPGTVVGRWPPAW